jgi:hypothetical protein
MLSPMSGGADMVIAITECSTSILNYGNNFEPANYRLDNPRCY